jgi:LPXTG-motif cell wall-anchored protein
MLTTTHPTRRLRAGALLATLGLGLPAGMAPVLAGTLSAQVEVQASATTDASAAGSDHPLAVIGDARVQANVSVDGGDGAGAEIVQAVSGLLPDGGLPVIGGGGGDDDPGSSGLSAEVFGLLESAIDGGGLPGVGADDLPDVGLPDVDLPGVGLPGGGLPGGVPGLGLPNLPGGTPVPPVRLPSEVLPSAFRQAPSGQQKDPALAKAGHVGPAAGEVPATQGGNTGASPATGRGGAPVNQPTSGPVQSVGGSPGSLPRTGADLNLRAFAAFGLLGLAGFGGRRRRSSV